MQHILIRHLTGSKVNQTEFFDRDNRTEILFGRGRTCTVRYDSRREDGVSRQHARLIFDELDRFTLVDLSSRNGTFVNDQRIFGFVKVRTGDVIRLGHNGPEFELTIQPHTQLKFPSARNQIGLRISREKSQLENSTSL